MNDYDEMREIQRVRQLEIAAWRTAQSLDEARELEIISINRVTNPDATSVLPSLNEPIEEEDSAAEVTTPAVEVVAPKPKTKVAKPAS